MTQTRHEVLACPKCGAAMNHHADKLVYNAQAASGEVLEEFHRCPKCGTGVSRRAPSNE